jgi:RNA polymerase sigma-70 factor (ECF subfamily)
MGAHDPLPEPAAGNRAFPTTRWSIVLTAGRTSSQDSRRALVSLCETYWSPLYAYVRRRVPDVNEAQDLTQEFFAELLEKNYVGAAVPARGRFRAFLLTAFKHFLSREWEKARAQKRGGGRVLLPLDFDSAESTLHIDPAGGLTPDQYYDQQWAITLLAQIMDRLEAEFDDDGKGRQFAELKDLLIGTLPDSNYAQAAARLNMTVPAIRKAASRLRKRYRELLREEIAQTVSDPGDVDDELRSLLATLE